MPSGTRVDTFTPVERDAATDILASGKIDVGEDLRCFLSGEPPLFVVNDGYRHTPTFRILEWIDAIDHGLIDNAGFLVATGAHGAPSPDHLKRIFGSHLERVRPRLSYHDANDRSAMTRIGKDSLGGEVFVSSQVLDAAKVFVISSVEPHYFAGFSGGRKSFFPGLCDFATIERNHNLASSLEAASLKLDGNPVAEHLEELMKMLQCDNIFAAQAVTDSHGRIIDLCLGPLESAFHRATHAARKLFARQVGGRYDTVISEMLPPLDRNLYQAQKALENTQVAVADGGSAIIVSACEEGVGSEYFFKLAAKWDRDTNMPEDGVVTFGSHKLSRVNAMTRRIDVRLYSELPDETARQVFYEPLESIDEFLEIQSREKQHFRVAVVRDAGHMVLTN